ncbi:MFS transporter [Flavobacterium rakeshii]|uniref:MFS transporter n=1 Tax=Flavobacterium rakeshii TaxID=1038845 RepID=A0A6N8HG57_9FLAO|nr:MFS transporter [Flavobacterium rakeshii]MUV04646.1 MFS transporter [Flavobacterium rakeshii]
MKNQKSEFLHISTILAFILIPLGGLTTDIYIPSLPAMAHDLGVSVGAIQLSLLLFMISSGFSQLFIGSILDSFGRYRISSFALLIFAVASFAIALTSNIYVIYAMRVIQGITVSLIIVGKRAFFVDMYSGSQLKHYTSLFSIVWATAPIVAPFLGGYLQEVLGWQSSFYFLGSLAVIVLIMEIRFSGESLSQRQPFRIQPIVKVYKEMLKTTDFTLGLLIIGLSYSLLVVYGMVSPFIIEKVYGYSPVITGYSSLVSGVALMSGGIMSKLLLKRALFTKLDTAIILQLIAAAVMWLISVSTVTIWVLIVFTAALHLASGFIFNNVYAYSLQRFTHNAGTASGLTGGGIYVISSVVGYGLINSLSIKSVHLLSSVNLGIVLLLLVVLVAFKHYVKARTV